MTFTIGAEVTCQKFRFRNTIFPSNLTFNTLKLCITNFSNLQKICFWITFLCSFQWWVLQKSSLHRCSCSFKSIFQNFICLKFNKNNVDSICHGDRLSWNLHFWKAVFNVESNYGVNIKFPIKLKACRGGFTFWLPKFLKFFNTFDLKSFRIHIFEWSKNSHLF